MASYQAIAAISATLKGVLDGSRPPELDGFAVDIVQLADFHKPKVIDDGVTILLYRVAVGNMPRALTGRPEPDGRRKLPSLPVDLYYLLTPWARVATMQLLLLGWLMRTLEDNATLDSGALNYYGMSEHVGSDHVFDDGESVSLIPEPLQLQDTTNLWEALKPHAHVSVAYVARYVHIDSAQPSIEGERVQVREFQYAKARV